VASKHTHQSTRIKTHTHWHAHLHGIPGQVQVRRQPVSTRTLPAVARARSEGTKLTRSTRSKLPSSLPSKCPIPIQVKPCPRCGCGLGCGCGCGCGCRCGLWCGCVCECGFGGCTHQRVSRSWMQTDSGLSSDTNQNLPKVFDKLSLPTHPPTHPPTLPPSLPHSLTHSRTHSFSLSLSLSRFRSRSRSRAFACVRARSLSQGFRTAFRRSRAVTVLRASHVCLPPPPPPPPRALFLSRLLRV
jgi:hypothetical protein